MLLNDKQKEAVNHKEGPCLVLAGAGSGKTRVLTERIINLIDSGVSPYNILAITFTNKAAKEMRNRVELKLGDISNSIFIGTFHSFGLRVLRENYYEIGYTSNITILDSDDSKSLIKRILKELDLDPKQYDIKHIISRISSAKNELVDSKKFKIYAKTYIDENIAKAFNSLCVKRGDQKEYINAALADYIQKRYKELQAEKPQK